MAAHALSSMEFDFLWESVGAGEVPYPLELRSHGATMSERSELRRQALGALANRGVVDQRGVPHPRVSDQFGLLAGASVSVDSVHIPDPGAKAVLAVGGAAGDQALLAVQDTQGLRLRELPADGLASAVTGLFPPAPRGRERSVTLPLDTLVAGAGADFLQRRNGSAADDDRKTLARLHVQPRLRGGQIGVNVRAAAGGRSRSPVLSWFDTESGRYLTQVSRGADGRDWITIAPADAATLRHRIGEMLRELTAAHGMRDAAGTW